MNNEFNFSRRQFLRQSGLGFGSLALASLCTQSAQAAASSIASPFVSPLAPRFPHFNGTTRRIIFLYMWGGPSQMDLFDPKPRLNVDHGKMGDEKRKRAIKGSPFKFENHGQGGLEISEVLPH